MQVVSCQLHGLNISAFEVNKTLLVYYVIISLLLRVTVDQCFSTFVRPRPGKFFFYKTRARPQQIYS